MHTDKFIKIWLSNITRQAYPRMCLLKTLKDKRIDLRMVEYRVRNDLEFIWSMLYLFECTKLNIWKRTCISSYASKSPSIFLIAYSELSFFLPIYLYLSCIIDSQLSIVTKELSSEVFSCNYGYFITIEKGNSNSLS